MAFAAFTRTLPTPTATLSGFVCLLTEDWWTQADANAMDGTTFINGGGSIRCYTDSSKTTRLPVEVVEFVTGGTPSAQVWVRVPSYSGASTTIYIESDAVATTQPIVTDTYGRNAVWQDYEGAFHCEDTNWTDSTGNGDLTVDGSAAPTVVGTALGNAYRFNASDSTHLTRALTSSITAAPITVQLQFINRGTPAYTLYAGGVSGTAGGRDFSVGGISGTSSIQIRDTFPVNQGRQFVVDTVAGAIGDEYRVNSVFDSGNLTSSGWINGTFGTDTIARTLSTTLVNLGIGGRIDGSPDYYDVDVASFRVLTVARSQDHLDSEYDNESDPANFGTSSGWTTGGGSGDSITADSGSYSLSGTQISLTASFTIPSEQGLFILSGSALSFSAGRALIAEQGGFTLTGTEINVRAAYRDISSSGVYDLTGTDVTLIYTPVTPGDSIVVESGVIELTGANVSLFSERKLLSDSGDYSILGNGVDLRFGSLVTANSGEYSLVGDDLSLLAGYGIISGVGDYLIFGTDVTLKYSGDTAQTIGVVTASFADSGITTEYKQNEITVTFKGL